MNDTMKLNKYQGQRQYLIFAKGNSDYNIKTVFFFSETIESFGTKFLVKAYG